MLDIIKRKGKWNVLLLGFIILIIAVIFYQSVSNWQESKISPEDLFISAVENTLNSTSFRYSINTELGRENAASKVMGARIEPDRVCVQGEIQNTSFEIIQIGDTTYFKESITDSWLTIEGNKLANAELFTMELNPLSMFFFKEIIDIDYKGLEKVGGDKLVLLEFKPVVQNELLHRYYNDFFYQVWVDPSEKFIRKAVIEATGAEGENNRTVLSVELWDYNKQMEINPPDGH